LDAGGGLWQFLVAPAEPFAFRRQFDCHSRRKSSQSAAVVGFCSPPTGVVNARLFVTAMEGDPSKTGDQMLFGPATNSLQVLSGPNNLANNFSPAR